MACVHFLTLCVNNHLILVGFLQEMLNEARQRLANVAKDPAKYPALMDGLILQVSSSSWFLYIFYKEAVIMVEFN